MVIKSTFKTNLTYRDFLIAEERQPIPWLDFFIPTRIQENSDDFSKARLLVGICIAISASIYAFILTVLLFLPLEVGGFFITIPLASFFLLLLFIFKKTGSILIISNLIIGMAVFAISLGVYISGGPVRAPASVLMTIPTLLSFSLLGLRWGIFWSTFTLLVQTIFHTLLDQGFIFANSIPDKHLLSTQVTNWYINFGFTMVIFAVYARMQSSLKKERDAQEQRFLFLATHDGLTQLPNRVLFYDRASTAIARSKRNGDIFALLYLNLNGFKQVNDTYGHKAGDAVLIEVSQRIKSSVRDSDVVARFGGDEFAIIIEGIKNMGNAQEISAKILKRIEESIVYKDSFLFISTSIGISYYPTDSIDIDELLSHADTAMFKAKASKEKIIRFDKAG